MKSTLLHELTIVRKKRKECQLKKAWFARKGKRGHSNVGSVSLLSKIILCLIYKIKWGKKVIERKVRRKKYIKK